MEPQTQRELDAERAGELPDVMTPAVDLGQVRGLVDRAVRAAVPAGQMVERRIRPDSSYSWPEPQPLAGLHAALTVVELAQAQAYTFAAALRGEGSTWRQIADLLKVPWSDEYSRVERAYELVAGGNAYGHRQLSICWTCGGPIGCGSRVTDYGPYNGCPDDNETGHAGGCRRLAFEVEEWGREREESEARNRNMDEAMELVTDPFGRASVKRARYVRAHGGRYLGWSTDETLAVALILDDVDQMRAHGFSTRRAALQRILPAQGRPAEDPDGWLRTLRIAATGLTDPPAAR